MTKRILFLPLLALALGGMDRPETRIAVTLPAALPGKSSGRLLIFAEPVAANREGDVAPDVDDPNAKVSIAARDVPDFGIRREVLVDTQETAFPEGFAALAPGYYRVQAVLDRNGDYNYSGLAPDDLLSKVVTVHFPLRSIPSLALDHAPPPEREQFDTTGFPPAAVEQIAASRAHLHDEHVASAVLTKFRGARQEVAAWVLTPPGYDPNAKTTYPTVYEAGGFLATHKLDGQQLSTIWHLMETHAIPPMIWVALDYGTQTGTTEFADSVNNGPWGDALVHEVIPALEAKYRMDARPSGRFLTGHSSGGWFATWVMVRYPASFGGSWPTSPDPVDFHDFVGVDLYAPGANMYRDAAGALHPLERDHDKIRMTIEQEARQETVLGHTGGQLQSFDWTFSPRSVDGRPLPMFDRETGAVDPTVVAYWRDHYDIAHRIETGWPSLRKDLDGKLHVRVGTVDSNYLDGPVHRLEAAFRKVGGHAQFTYVAGATHSMSEVYADGGDRKAYWKEMTRAMYAIARPHGTGAWDLAKPEPHP